MRNPDVTLRNAVTTDRRDWDAAAHHPLQSWAWGDFRIRMGIDVARLVAGRDGSVESVWQTTFHRIPHLPACVGYAPKTPFPDAAVLDALSRLGTEKQALYIQMEPDISKPAIPASPDIRLMHSHRPMFTTYTFVLDLTRSEDELLAAMHSKTRYNLKVAARHGVAIREDNSPEAFEAYLKLEAETTSRQGFYAHNDTYHRTMWDIMRHAGIAHLFTATYEKTTLAAWIIFDWQDTIYYPYGASSRDHREVMAPGLLLWEIARWGKRNGKHAFDLWGALGPEPDRKDPWYGFHRFKEGFNPALVETAGSFDLVINPTGYRLFTIADKARWAWLAARKRIGR